MRKSGTVSFKKGLFKSDKSLGDTYKNVLDKKEYFSMHEPGDIIVVLLDEESKPMMEWKIIGAIPTKLSNGDLKSEENAIAIEQMDVVHSGIELTFK
jgi:phage tail-like protein